MYLGMVLFAAFKSLYPAVFSVCKSVEKWSVLLIVNIQPYRQRIAMANFFVALWESIFQPGTTPQLIIATHVSFFALLCTLAWLIYATSGNIHFYALFAIASCLWIAVIWFIQELNSANLMDNKQLEEPEKETGGKTEEVKEQPRSSTVRSRKV